MPKKKSNAFRQGKDLYETDHLGYKVYLEAALWAARANDIPLAEVKETIKQMVANHIIQELGYEPEQMS